MSSTLLPTSSAISSGVVSGIATATGVNTAAALSTVTGPLASQTAPVASASSAVVSGVASILPVPSQAIGSAVAPAVPTKRWMKWE